jgi:hypothetical protein
MSPRGALVLAIAGASGLAGCRGIAMTDVHRVALQQESIVSRSAARLEVYEADAYLDELGEEVLAAACDMDRVRNVDGPGPLDVYDRFDIYLVHSEMPNAWTYGDDFVCISTALLLEAESPEEVAAVLAHEFGHIREGHLVEERERFMFNEAMANTLVVLGAAADLALMTQGLYDPSYSVMEAAGQYARTMRADYSPYQPGDEFEADIYGLELYAELGLDTRYYDDFLQRMSCIYEESNAASVSHPGTAARLHVINSEMEALEPESSERSLDMERFREVQTLVAAQLVSRHQRGQLLTYEQSSSRWRRGGGDVVTVCACGPLDADKEVCHRRFKAAIARHIGEESAQAYASRPTTQHRRRRGSVGMEASIDGWRSRVRGRYQPTRRYKPATTPP